VLVTGAAGGLGLEIALEAARRGWTVHAGVRRPESSAELLAAARAEGLSVHPVTLDVRDRASIGDAVESVLGRTGGTLNALVHNAGVVGAGWFEELTDSVLDDVVTTNFLGPVYLTRALLPALRSATRPRLVVVSTVGVYWPSPTWSMYCATKSAVEGWAETLAVELAPFDVAVSVVQPGAYRSGLVDKIGLHSPDGGPYAAMNAAVESRLRKALGGIGRNPVELGRAVGHLLDSPSPPLKMTVGLSAKVLHVLRRILPAPARRALTLRLLGMPSRGYYGSGLPGSRAAVAGR
jgi:NAD(P)-dependent dehydrogenase (short-subunit alcohol dehydrogenase family)